MESGLGTSSDWFFRDFPIACCRSSQSGGLSWQRGKIAEINAGDSDYLNAVENLGQIKSADCRQLALSRFHYLDMAQKYVRQYEREIETWSNRAETVVSDVALSA